MADIREIVERPAHWYRFPAGRWTRKGHTGHWWGRLGKHFEVTEGGERVGKTSLTLSDGGVVDVILENEPGVVLPTEHGGHVDVSNLCEEEIRHLGLHDLNAGRPKRTRAQAKKMDCDKPGPGGRQIPRKTAEKLNHPANRKARDIDPTEFPDIPARKRVRKFMGQGAKQEQPQSRDVQGDGEDAETDTTDPEPSEQGDGDAQNAASQQGNLDAQDATPQEPPAAQAIIMACSDASAGADPTSQAEGPAAEDVPAAPGEAPRTSPSPTPSSPAPTTPPNEPPASPIPPSNEQGGDPTAVAGDAPDGLALIQMADEFLRSPARAAADPPASIPRPADFYIAIGHNYGLFACRSGNYSCACCDRPYRGLHRAGDAGPDQEERQAAGFQEQAQG